MCGEIDIESLKRDKDQLWAEAVVAFRAGEKWYLDEEELIAAAAVEQTARSKTDVWDERIRQFLTEEERRAQDAGRQVFLTRADVLRELGIPDRDQTQPQANRVADCLIRFGWERFRIGSGAMRGTWAYRPKKSS
jgi:predicted P-loop ATPase